MRLTAEALMVLLAAHAVGAEPFGAAYTGQWSAALNAEIDGRIEKFRKVDGEFAIPGLAADTEVFVEQIESDFKFGCNIFNFDQFGDERKNAEYRAAFLPGGLFNAATVPFYWNALEPEKGHPRYARVQGTLSPWLEGCRRAEAIR